MVDRMSHRHPDQQLAYDSGIRLSHIRTGAGMSLGELSDASGVALVSIANFERGSRLPGTITLVRLATALHVTVTEILGR